MLNSVGERTPPCGTPDLIDIVRMCDFHLYYVVYDLRPLMIVPVILVCSSFLITVYVYCVESSDHIE